ncbi:nucleotidyltransferase [Planomicrobium sp. CPCC 101110]|uniref:nucleotidyltransferase n=1 Tax=Planomicrobium sp. CPCC 101110 TaxID=2599619 RepID=UPI0011B425B5|nr:nucleotidyltransferase [Planomicrobium sp. CPCC 101110]TWT28088.1 nucleotidyltransferase [Planomicrobium sp. CPCC 101110]
MKATGIIVEYNPFHNGHLHHAESSKEKAGADVLVAVMSGQFLQRGEPAFADKWTRTEMALRAGIDLVIELPYAYATAQASDFAKGGIALLDAIGCESFCFGSEQGEIEPFLRSHRLLDNRREDYERLIHETIQTGVSYPMALNKAYTELTGSSNGFADLTQPNNILGFHYLEAARKLNSPIKPLTIQRIGANYHDPIHSGTEIASATGIRKAFFGNSSIEELSAFMPETSILALKNFQKEVGSFGSWDRFYPLLRYTILRERPEGIHRFAEVTEGIENLIYEAAKKEEAFEKFIGRVKSKRFTRTRVQRMLTHIYTGFTWEKLHSFESPGYLRLLGMSATGRSYLNQQKKNIGLPIISRAASLDDSMGKLDIHATSMYLLGLGQTALKKEYTTPPLYFG